MARAAAKLVSDWAIESKATRTVFIKTSGLALFMANSR
jgi:hypothetical protein